MISGWMLYGWALAAAAGVILRHWQDQHHGRHHRR
jgi:hypothetical protein